MLTLPPLDQEEELERQGIETALAAVAVADTRFKPWWPIYRNHHKGPVIILPHHRGGEGTYLWHFHVIRHLDGEEQAELLSAMRAIVCTALTARNVEIKAEVHPEGDFPTAAIVFSVPVSPEEARRRVDAHRLWNDEYTKLV